MKAFKPNYYIVIFAIILSIFFSIYHNAFAEENIVVLENSTDNYFPDALKFNIAAKSSSTINRIRLNYIVEKMNYAEILAEAWPKFQPGLQVKTSWIWDMRKGNLPPSTKINYWWTIENTEGERFITEVKETIFTDKNHQWQQKVAGSLHLYWYAGNEEFANTLIHSAEEALDRLFKDTGIKLDKKVQIFIYNGSEDLQKSMISPREWTGGVAFTDYSTIVIGITPTNLAWGKNALAHELGHMVIHQITYSPYGSNLPTWLDEGLAMYTESSKDEYLQSILKKALKNGTLLSLRSLSSPFSAITDEALLSYAESQSVVEFLIKNYGKEKIFDLLKLVKDGILFDDALIKIYGFNQEGLEDLWIKYLKQSISSIFKPYEIIEKKYDFYIQANIIMT